MHETYRWYIYVCLWRKTNYNTKDKTETQKKIGEIGHAWNWKNRCVRKIIQILKLRWLQSTSMCICMPNVSFKKRYIYISSRDYNYIRYIGSLLSAKPIFAKMESSGPFQSTNKNVVACVYKSLFNLYRYSFIIS